MTAPYTGPASRGPWDDTPARLCAELRARPDGWTEKDVDRICYALAYYPTGDAAIGGVTVNGVAGHAWMQVDADQAHLSVYGDFGARLYRVSVSR